MQVFTDNICPMGAHLVRETCFYASRCKSKSFSEHDANSDDYEEENKNLEQTTNCEEQMRGK